MKIALIGAGAMGGALAEGLISHAHISPEDFTISDPSKQALERFNNTGVTLTSDNNAAVINAELVFVVVKPWLVKDVVSQIKNNIDYNKATVIVIAAGVASSDIMSWMTKTDGSVPTLILSIPNTAISVGQSMTFLVPINATEPQLQVVESLFNKMGSAMMVDEEHLPAGTSIASCGIAYAMRYVRAVTEGSVEMGFRPTDALHIVTQTVRGALDLLEANGSHPEAEIDKVTTPGGVAIRGLNAMEDAGFTSAVIKGLKAGTGKRNN